LSKEVGVLEKKFLIAVVSREVPPPQEVIMLQLQEELAPAPPGPIRTTMLRLSRKEYDGIGKPSVGDRITVTIRKK